MDQTELRWIYGVRVIEGGRLVESELPRFPSVYIESDDLVFIFIRLCGAIMAWQRDSLLLRRLLAALPTNECSNFW